MSKWKNSQIKDFGRVITGYTPSTSNLSLWGGDIPFYSPTDFNDDVFCSKTERTINDDAISNDRVVQENSLMVTCIASIGKIALATKKGITNQQINSILFNDKFDPKYCYYLIKNNINELIKLGGTTAVPIVNKADFEKIYLRHHSDKTEQQHIAKILSTADAVIEKTQAAIAKYKAIKQGMLQDLFTRGIDVKTGKLRPRYEDAPDLYKESKLGWIPREWEIKQLGELCTMKSGDGITSENIYELSDYPVYGGNGLRGFTSKFTHEGEFTLIGRQGALCGNITRVSGKFYASEHAVVVTPEHDIELDWLSQKLFSMNLNQYSEATAQPGLSVFKILPLPVETPLFPEQQKIAERLKSIDNKIQTEQTYLEKMQSLKKGLMEDLLSGRKRVKVAEELITQNDN